MPDLAALPGVDTPESLAARGDVAGCAAARFSAVRRLSGGWRGWLGRSLGLGGLAATDAASVVAASVSQDSRGAWLATPLQLAAGMQTVHVPVDGILDPGSDEAHEWSRDFARVFGSDGLRLLPLPGTGFLLLGLDAPGVLTVDPGSLVGRSLEAALPEGSHAARLRALMTEMEMWLHEHRINALRQRRGEAAIASFWLWGGGGPAYEAAVEGDRPVLPWGRLYADDPWVAAVARLSGTPLLPPPDSFDAHAHGCDGRTALVVSPGRLGAGAEQAGDGGLLDAIDRRYVRPAVEALRAGTLDGITLVAGDRAAGLSGTDRLRFWRPSRDWPRALSG